MKTDSDDDVIAPHASLLAFCTVAAYYRIPADPLQLARELSLVASPATNEEADSTGRRNTGFYLLPREKLVQDFSRRLLNPPLNTL